MAYLKHLPMESNISVRIKNGLQLKPLTFTGAVNETYDGSNSLTVNIPIGKKPCRFVVGSTGAGYTADDVDYLCDGTADEVEINAAIAALPENGGEVRLLDGQCIEQYCIKSRQCDFIRTGKKYKNSKKLRRDV